MISICTAATRSYLYAWPQLIRAIATAAAHHEEAHFIFATDQSEEAKKAAEYAKVRLPEGWKITTLNLPITEDEKSYKESAQIRIAQLQGEAFEFARRIKADLCWSVESDTIPPAHALRVLEWTLSMPQSDGKPYYDIAAATYPNHMFLGGFGDTRHQIAEDFLPEERKLKSRLKLLLEKCEERLKAIPKPTNAEEAKKAQSTAKKEGKRMGRLREWIKKSPPIGNIFELNAKGYRRRGWMDFAYPGIGLGAVVPTDWCGLGCTLLSKAALAHADFTGYEGRGTQDLFLCWSRWHPAGLRLACVPHVACDHIKRKSDKEKGKSEIVHYRAYHEQEGECRGHLRQRQQAFVAV